jgi:putative transposase
MFLFVNTKKKDICTLYFKQLIPTCMLLKIVRNITSTIVVMYSLYLYFLVGLSLRNTSKALDIFDDEKRSNIAICNRIQKFGSCNLYKRKRISTFLIAEIVIN